MAEINGIEFQVRGSADSAANSLDNLASSLSKIKSVTKDGIGLGSVSAQMKNLKSASSGFRQYTESIKEADASSKKWLGNIGKAFGRIAYYRLIRSAIREVAQAFSEGLKNAYQFSKANGGALAASLDLVSSKSLTMKNQLGAAFGGLLTAIAPVVVTIISLVTRLATALSMLFAVLGGSSTFKKATDAWTDWGEAAGGAGGAAKEALKYLAPFDELNVLPDEKSGGGGGGANMPSIEDMFDYEDVPEWLQNFSDKMKELNASIKITFSDVFIDWSDLTGEQIAEKIIVGLTGLLGGVAGFIFGGGVPGALSGTLTGVSIGLLISSLIFDHDGTISESEIKSMIEVGLNGLVGGVIGFAAGGPGGALLGATIALGVTATIMGLQFVSGGTISGYLESLKAGLTAGTTASIGWKVGSIAGIEGALLGATIGLAIGFVISGVSFDPIKGKAKEDIEQYLEDLDEEFKDAKPGTYQQQYYQHFHDYAVREMEGSGSDAGDSFLTKFKAKWDEILGGKTFGEWLLAGVGDIADDIALIFTGMTWEDLDQWLSDGGELIKGWLADLPAKFKNAGIKMINALKTEIIGGLNQTIEDINNSGFAQWMGIHFDPLPINLIPEIPEEELTKNYDKAKSDIEARSKEQPVYMTWEIAENPESFSVEDLLGDGGKELSFQAKITKLDLASNLNPPILNSTANFNDWQCYGSKTDSKVRAFTTWKSTANWNDYQVYGNKSASSIARFTTWNSTANFVRKTVDSTKVTMDGTNIKMNVTANVTKFTGKATIDVSVNQKQAKGGVFSGGQWHNIQQFASGGLARGSQLFWAREAGPELVGTLGGHTAVMNNDQIVASVSAGVARAISSIKFHMTGFQAATMPPEEEVGTEDAVYRAMMRALNDSEFGVNVDLDGEPLYANVVRRNRQNIRATGVNQLATA